MTPSSFAPTVQVLMRRLSNPFKQFAALIAPGKTPEIVRYLFALLPPSPVIVEAGAHNGLHTVWLSILSGTGTVHAFEPVPTVYRQLISNTFSRRNVCRYKLAVSGMCGHAAMHISAGGSDASSSLHAPKEHLAHVPSVTFDQSLTVDTITLDAWADSHGVRKVDLLWLDMQGHELAALQAAPRVLESVSVVYMEVSLVELYEGALLYPEVRAWMESRGFVVIREDLSAEAGDIVFSRTGNLSYKNLA